MADLQNQNNIQTPMHIPPQSGVRHSHLGPILAVLIIVILLIFCGLYIWGGMLSKEAAMLEEVAPAPTEDTSQESTPSSDSDSLESIEADILSTDFKTLDTEILKLDAELNTALAE